MPGCPGRGSHSSQSSQSRQTKTTYIVQPHGAEHDDWCARGPPTMRPCTPHSLSSSDSYILRCLAHPPVPPCPPSLPSALCCHCHSPAQLATTITTPSHHHHTHYHHHHHHHHTLPPWVVSGDPPSPSRWPPKPSPLSRPPTRTLPTTTALLPRPHTHGWPIEARGALTVSWTCRTTTSPVLARSCLLPN
jgi:hypothetical protein